MPTTKVYTLSLHDALPISPKRACRRAAARARRPQTRGTSGRRARARSEEHTSELQSRENLVCRLLLEKKKILTIRNIRCVTPSRLRDFRLTIARSRQHITV